MGEEKSTSKTKQEEPEKDDKNGQKRNWRNLVAFWIFGLCNNFAYVVMLSAAHDILKEDEKSSGHNITTVLVNKTQNETDPSFLECNTVSTGAILLADILPTLVVKFTFPFFLEKIPYGIKISLVAVFALSSFLIVALAHAMWLSILGVVFASVSSGLGEIAFLSLTTFYSRNVVSLWSSGTGGAGIFGSLVYAGFTSAGLSPRDSLLIMVVIPVLMMVAYLFILDKPEEKEHNLEMSFKKLGSVSDNSVTGLEGSTVTLYRMNSNDVVIEQTTEITKYTLTLKEKVRLIPTLFKYMIPLTLVYFGEYFINQGLHELLYFNGQWLSKSEQYRWYQVDYQIGVFISRSSVNLIHIKALWVLPVLQFVNLALLTCQIFYRYIPNIWIIFAIVLWEGLLGGAAYVNTFYKITNDVSADKKEYCISMAAISDSIGIALAGAAAIPSHNAICGLNLKM
ncbi:battenin-like [Physella acuta]|uniref:battenin-like n=1 Tax=Physella acuta TaxID=109671 RepID=UPI0027DE207B|nr:battenin-like [Physella acuta]